MKTIISFLAIVLMLNISAICQENSSSMKFPVNDYNFGVIKEEAGEASYNFELINEGNAPIIITRVSTSCGCTTPEWTKEPIAPNGKGFVKAIYDPKGRPGPFSKTITVYTNINPSGTVLTIRGNVTPRPKTAADIFPRRLDILGLTSTHASLNRVYVKQVKTDTIGTYNFGDKPLKLTFDAIPPHILVKAVPETLKPASEGKIIITFDTRKRDEWGFVVDRFKVLVNNDNPQNNLISVSASIEEDFSLLTEEQRAKAPQISFKEMNKDFGKVKEGETINHEFLFTNTGQSDLIIRKIKASCGCTTVNPKVTVIKPGQSSSLSASFRTSGFTGRQSKSITVITNDPKSPTLMLRLSGTVEAENKPTE
jgi:hypothetical protein